MTPILTSAQITWTITDYEWRNRPAFEKYINPDQWINKIITFKKDTITFDFKGIQDFEADINYKDCALLNPIDTIRIQDKQQFLFLHNLDMHLNNRPDQVLLLETKPNCYKFPFRDFILCDKKCFIELMGVLFIMRRE
jgi:hypothetical protein